VSDTFTNLQSQLDSVLKAWNSYFDASKDYGKDHPRGILFFHFSFGSFFWKLL
jgi:hypothetical protein